MITEFCMNCGSKFEYSTKKPNFCSSCGSPLDQVEAKPNQAQNHEVSEASEIAESRISTSLSKLEYSIDKGHSELTFGDLVGRASSDPNSEYNPEPIRPMPKNDTNTDALKESIAQCKPKREPEDIGG